MEAAKSEQSRKITRFVVLGGYLGAGKTTLATALAKELRDRRGLSVAIITNDQGNVLVDTEFVKNAGFDVRDVMGGCFCSNFDQFVKNARSLVQMSRPDVIIAEPIGTSTNILSSVVMPLRTMYPDEFEVAPLMIVLDGTRASQLLQRSTGLGLGGGRLIPSHQVQEAEYVLISKADQLSTEQVQAAVDKVKQDVPDVQVLPCSSHSGINIAKVAEVIASGQKSEKAPRAVDQKLFALEKASMGWYNANAIIRAEERVDLYDLVTSLMREVANRFDPESIAHVKVLVQSPKVAAKMSLVMDSLQVDGIRGGRYLTEEGKLVVNARISASPQQLQEAFSKAITDVTAKLGITVDGFSEVFFKPKPETPDHFLK